MGYSPWGRKESDTTERLNFGTVLGVLPRKISIKSHKQSSGIDIIITVLEMRKHFCVDK